jgi:predicted phosphoribosyltransferase
MMFLDRRDAGRMLARRLESLAGRAGVIVLALPRGGVPVAFEVAAALRAPLDVFVVRKLGVPGQEELAMGALASGGVRVLNQEVVETLAISAETIEAATRREQEELARREQLYRGSRERLDLADKIAILIDDGLATGSSMRAAIAALRLRRPKRLIVAVPVAARATCDRLRADVDEMICLATPQSFIAVGQWYAEFGQTTDDEVRELLRRSAAGM